MQLRFRKNIASPAQQAMSHDRRKSAWVELWQRYTWYMLAFEVVLIAAAGYWFLVSTPIQALLSSKGELTAREQAAQLRSTANQRDIAALRELIGQYEKITPAQQQAIDAFLPGGPKVDTLFSQLEAMAKQNGLLLSSIELNDATADAEKTQKRSRLEVTEKAPAGTADERGLQELNITITLGGVGYPSLKNFLNALEHNIRLIDVASVAYDPVGATAEVVFVAYYFGAPL